MPRLALVRRCISVSSYSSRKLVLTALHVPYRGTAAAMPDLLSGRIAMMLDGVPVQTPNIRAGTLFAIAVTTQQRSPALPDVPTMMEVRA